MVAGDVVPTRALCSVAGVPEEPLWTTCMGVIKKNMSSWTGRAQGKNVTLSHHQLWHEWKKGPLLLACRGVLICLGCCSKILLAEWFMGNRRLFHTILKVGSWKSGCQQTWYLKRTHFLLHKQCLLSAWANGEISFRRIPPSSPLVTLSSLQSPMF